MSTLPYNILIMDGFHMGSKRYSSGLLRVLLLSELAAGESHGYALAQKLIARSDGEILVGASNLYPVLNRMEADGLVTIRWIEGKNGRPQKQCALTVAGRLAAEEDVQDFMQLTRAMISALERS